MDAQKGVLSWGSGHDRKGFRFSIHTNPDKVASVSSHLVWVLRGKAGRNTSEKGRAMQDILLKLVRSVVLAPEKVVVTQITAKPPAYKIQVAQPDFQPVLSKIHAIKTLALTIAELPTGETLILHLDVI